MNNRLVIVCIIAVGLGRLVHGFPEVDIITQIAFIVVACLLLATWVKRC